MGHVGAKVDKKIITAIKNPPNLLSLLPPSVNIAETPPPSHPDAFRVEKRSKNNNRNLENTLCTMKYRCT